MLAPVRAEWTSQAWQAHLASPEAFIQQYTPVTPDGVGGWQVGLGVGLVWGAWSALRHGKKLACHKCVRPGLALASSMCWMCGS